MGQRHNSPRPATFPPRSMHSLCKYVLILCPLFVLFLFLFSLMWIPSSFSFWKKKKMCAVMYCFSLQLAPKGIDGSNYTSQNRTGYLANFVSVLVTNCSIRIYNKALFSDFTNVKVGLAISGSVSWLIPLMLSTGLQVHVSSSNQKKSIGTTAWDLSSPNLPWPLQSSERLVQCWIRRTGFPQWWTSWSCQTSY